VYTGSLAFTGAANCFSKVCAADAALSRLAALARATTVMSSGETASVNATTNDAVFVPVLTVLDTMVVIGSLVTVFCCEKFPPDPLFVPFPEFRKTIGVLPVGNAPVGPSATGRPLLEMNLRMLLDMLGSTYSA
jgi:hypothetical protein